MSTPFKQGIANPGRTQVHDDEDALDLTLARKPSTTIREVQREIALRQTQHKLGITQAEWLRLKQEILKFLRSMKEDDTTNEDVAVAFLNDTGANDRFFGLLAGGEAEGMPVNRARLAWGIDDDRIVPQIAAIVAAWRPTASSYEGSKVQDLVTRTAGSFSNDEQIAPAKPKLNPKVLAMLPADIAEICGVTTAQYEKNNSPFVGDDQSFQRQRRHEPAILPRISSQVQTALAPKHDHWQRETFPPKRLSDVPLDVFLGESEHSASPLPTAPQPWLKVFLYVGGERKVQAHKLLMIKHSGSLAGFNSQVFNAYYRQLEEIRRNLQSDSIRCYIVHYGFRGSGNVARIEANDDRAWKAALDVLQAVGNPDQVVLKGHVEVHF